MEFLERRIMIERQVQRDRLKAQAQAAESRFNHGLGLKQFTVLTERPLKHTFRDETAWQGIANASR